MLSVPYVDVADRAANQRAAQDAVKINDSEPVTTIQVCNSYCNVACCRSLIMLLWAPLDKRKKIKSLTPIYQCTVSKRDK